MATLLPRIRCFFESQTNTAQYVVSCPNTNKAVIIDPVLDFDFGLGSTSTNSADALLSYIAEEQLNVLFLLETHVHADHITAAFYLQGKLEKQGEKPLIAISEHVVDVQKVFADIYDMDIPCDGSQFGQLLKDEDKLQVGDVQISVMETPGHTPACVSYLLNDDSIFVGDTLFMVCISGESQQCLF
jgi:glyoxylase-like metal-dependent hydrolase (beta-lactamase superfamily II)